MFSNIYLEYFIIQQWKRGQLETVGDGNLAMVQNDENKMNRTQTNRACCMKLMEGGQCLI